MKRRGTLALAAFVLVMSGCGVSRASGREGGSGDVPPVPTCRLGLELAGRWDLRQSIEVAAGGRVGTRRVYVTTAGHRLHLTAGIVGEFGEAFPQRATLVVSGGGVARLLGLPGSRTWVLVWSQADRCALRSVTGIGLRREAFMKVLRRSGLLGTEPAWGV